MTLPCLYLCLTMLSNQEINPMHLIVLSIPSLEQMDKNTTFKTLQLVVSRSLMNRGRYSLHAHSGRKKRPNQLVFFNYNFFIKTLGATNTKRFYLCQLVSSYRGLELQAVFDEKEQEPTAVVTVRRTVFMF